LENNVRPAVTALADAKYAPLCAGSVAVPLDRTAVLGLIFAKPSRHEQRAEISSRLNQSRGLLGMRGNMSGFHVCGSRAVGRILHKHLADILF
jgi:hypothetical protein